MTQLTKADYMLLDGKFNAIRREINALKSHLNSARLRERVIFAYKSDVCDQLTALFSTENTTTCTSEALKAFLQTNWTRVNGSMLAYTALPDDDLTDLFCSMAEVVVKYAPSEEEATEESSLKKDKGKRKASSEQALLWKKWQLKYEALQSSDKPSVLKVLMPTIKSTVSDDENYPNLDSCDIRWVLKSHILIHDGKYLLPASFLLSVCDVDKQSPSLFNPYWDSCGDDLIKSEASITPQQLTRLQVHSGATSLFTTTYQDYRAVTSDQNYFLGQLNALLQLLKFNDVQHTGSELHAGQGVYLAIIRFNDYYALLTEDRKKLIPAKLKSAIDELLDLSTDHKKNARKIFALAEFEGEEFKALKDFIGEQKTTLDHLTSNQAELFTKIESAKKDDEEYKAVFFEQKELDSLRLRLEQNDQQALSKKLPIKVRELNIATCIATRRDHIAKAMQGHDKTLAAISIAADTKQGLLEACHANLISARADLALSLIDEKNYQGSDKTLGLTLTLLDEPDITFELRGLVDIGHLMAMPKDDIKVLLDKEGFVKQLIDAIPRLGDLAVIFVENSDEKLKVLLKKAATSIADKFIKSTGDISALLIMLSQEKISVVCETMKDKLSEIIILRGYLGQVLSPLSPEQCAAVCTAMKDKLPEMIESGEDLGEALSNLSPEQCTAVCTAMKDKLSEIIRSSWDFRDVLCPLSPEKRTAVYTLMKDQLPEIIKSGRSLGRVFLHLSPEQCAAVCTVTKDKLPKIIKSGEVFFRVLAYLSPEERGVFCNDWLADFKKVWTAVKAVLINKKCPIDLSGEPSKQVIYAIFQYVNKKTSSLLAKSWNIYQKHAGAINDKNKALLNATYTLAYNRSSLFAKSNYNPNDEEGDKFTDPPSHSRRAKILSAYR